MRRLFDRDSSKERKYICRHNGNPRLRGPELFVTAERVSSMPPFLLCPSCLTVSLGAVLLFYFPVLCYSSVVLDFYCSRTRATVNKTSLSILQSLEIGNCNDEPTVETRTPRHCTRFYTHTPVPYNLVAIVQFWTLLLRLSIC